MIYTSEGTDNRNELTLIDLQSADWKPRKLIDGLNNEWSVVGNIGTKFYVQTNKDAPRNRIVTMDIAQANAAAGRSWWPRTRRCWTAAASSAACWSPSTWST